MCLLNQLIAISSRKRHPPGRSNTHHCYLMLLAEWLIFATSQKNWVSTHKIEIDPQRPPSPPPQAPSSLPLQNFTGPTPARKRRLLACCA